MSGEEGCCSSLSRKEDLHSVVRYLATNGLTVRKDHLDIRLGFDRATETCKKKWVKVKDKEVGVFLFIYCQMRLQMSYKPGHRGAGGAGFCLRQVAQGGQGWVRDREGASLGVGSDRDPDLPAGAEQQPAEGVGGEGDECSGHGQSSG